MAFWDRFFRKKQPVSSPTVQTPPREISSPAPVDTYRGAVDKTKNTIIRILNAFENDSGSPNTEYDKIYLYHDGPGKKLQVTLARGYTECGGSLWKVFEYYKANKGKNADKLLAYKVDNCKEKLGRDKDFLKLIIDSAKAEEAFRDAEDEVFDDVYWSKGQKYFDRYGFEENLSLAVIQDSILHSGSILPFLTNSFPEKTPANNGNEKKWIIAYLEARLNWLAHHSNHDLRNTIYRPKFFINQIEKNNWGLHCPISEPHSGAKIC